MEPSPFLKLVDAIYPLDSKWLNRIRARAFSYTDLQRKYCVISRDDPKLNDTLRIVTELKSAAIRNNHPDWVVRCDNALSLLQGIQGGSI